MQSTAAVPEPIPYDPQQVPQPQLIPRESGDRTRYPGAGAAEIRGIAE